ARKVELAEKLIETWTEDDFDFSEYKDTYQDQLKSLIDAKVAGRQVVAPASEEEEPEVINLMDALQASVSQRRPRAAAADRSPAATRRGPTATRRKTRTRAKRAS
ncbi:MAG TPA: hypothetical protein VJ809_11140, partial [Pirellulales bacterium]|nr:hypothetical protein [Pirellulales bacterium]